jgi:hypothetical protein
MVTQMMSLAWALAFVPPIGALCAHAALSNRWHRAWLVVFSLLANSQPLWIVGLIVAYCYSRPQLLGPFGFALVSSIISGPLMCSLRSGVLHFTIGGTIKMQRTCKCS